MDGIVTTGARKRCTAQIEAMTTPALKEMASMMEYESDVESEVLGLVIGELRSRGCKVDDLQIGTGDIHASAANNG